MSNRRPSLLRSVCRVLEDIVTLVRLGLTPRARLAAENLLQCLGRGNRQGIGGSEGGSRSEYRCAISRFFMRSATRRSGSTGLWCSCGRRRCWWRSLSMRWRCGCSASRRILPRCYLPVIFFGAATPGPMRSVAILLRVLLFPANPGEMTAFGFVQHTFSSCSTPRRD